MDDAQYYASEASSMNLRIQELEEQRDELLGWLIELVGQCSTLSADAKAQISPMTLSQCRAAIAKATGNDKAPA